MVDWAAAVMAAMIFVFLLKKFRVIGISRNVIALSLTIVSLLRDVNISDQEKEKSMQRFTFIFFRYFLAIILGSISALVLCYGLLQVGQKIDLISINGILKITLSWQFIAIMIFLGTLMFYFFEREN